MAETWTESEAIQTTIQEVVNKDDDSKGIVTRFVAVAEVLSDDGKKLVVYRGPNADSMPVWDVKALLREICENPSLFMDEDDEDG